MTIWVQIIVPSAFIGIAFAIFFPRKVGLICSGAIPWVGLLACLLYQEYCMPYRGGGASMWPIAQLFAGTVAAATGIASFCIVKYFANNIKNGSKPD